MQVREPEQVRGALAGLHVLVGDVVRALALRRRVADALEHQLRRGADVDLLGRDAERAHQLVRAVERVPAGAEAGQRVAEDVPARQAEPLEGAHRDQCRLRRVEPARDADHHLLDPGGGEALHQPLHLDVVHLRAALVAACRVGGHVREALDVPPQRHAARRHADVEVDAPEVAQPRCVRLRVVAEARHARAFLAQVIEVEVGGDQAGLGGEADRFREPLAVLVDQRVAVPGEVGGGLAGTRGGVQAAGDAARGMRGAQQPPIVRLADGDVAGGEVGQHRGAGERGQRARRQRDPQVLAHLEVQHEAGQIARLEQQVGAERHLLAAQAQRGGECLRSLARTGGARRTRGSSAGSSSAPRQAAARGAPARRS